MDHRIDAEGNHVIVSHGWVMPSALYSFDTLPPVEPPASCGGSHRWERATASGCSECCIHGPIVRQLECQDWACGATVAQDADGFEDLWNSAPLN